MIRCSLITLAVTLVALIAPALSAPHPATLALAQRYLAATGGTFEMIHEQAYMAAQIMGNLERSHQRQQALLDAATQHRADFDALDAQVAALMAETFTADELNNAVAFAESPAGRAINQKRVDYYAAIYSPFHKPVDLTLDETARLAEYNATPQALSMKNKSPAMLKQIAELATPLQKVLNKDANTIYCHVSRRCTDADGFDRVAGPSIREP